MAHGPQNIHHLETNLVSHSTSGIFYVGPMDDTLMDSLRLYSNYVCVHFSRENIYTFQQIQKGVYIFPEC